VRVDETSDGGQGGGEGIDQKHLRTDVEMDAVETNPGVGASSNYRRGRGTGRQGETELGVVLSGGDVVMGVGLYPWRDPQEYVEDMASAIVDPADSSEFVETVDHETPYPGSGSLFDLGFALVVAVHDKPVTRDSGLKSDEHLSTGGHVDLHLFLVCEAGHRQTQERLAGVHGPFPESIPSLATARPQVNLVIHEQGCPELSGKIQG
jgi:hypothetical protein